MISAPTKQLRDDELFVIKAIAASNPGSRWYPGENPPDAYLHIGKKKIAVEITRLVQSIADSKGAVKARLADDEPAIKLSEYLNKELNGKLPQGYEVHLTLLTPIVNFQRVKTGLKQLITELSRNVVGEDVVKKTDVCGNHITILFIHSNQDETRKVKSMVINTNSRKNTNIMENAKFILKDRMDDKSKKCESLTFKGPIWLALLNDYCIANIETYKKAFEQISTRHPFERIILVTRKKSVNVLYEKNTNNGRDLKPYDRP